MSSSKSIDKFEQERLLREWNQTKKDYELHLSLHAHIERQVEKTPQLLALIHGETQLRYEQLNHKANQLAHYLIQLGVKPDQLVGICIERSAEMVIGLLAIIKSGGAYVPLDPEYPADRLAFMASDSQVSVLLTSEKHRDKIADKKITCVCLDSDWTQIESNSTDNPNVEIHPDNLAYMIYTSGSTGKPKGAMNTHEAIVNRILWMQDMYQLSQADHVLQKTPFSFDVSVWEFFWPLMTGARLVMADPGGHKDPAYLVDTITRYGISTMHFVPSMLSLFLAAEGLENITSLRQVFCSGEALPLELMKRFFTRLRAKLHNLYGPTEAAVDVTYWECTPDPPYQTVPIGRPIANTQIYILDKDRKQVPIGEAGELHIGGIGLARGYWGRPELTAQKFIRNPFDDGNSKRLYKTGDLARHLPDGNIEYLGRIDFQVKIRGFRIELGEIESVLLQHPSVSEAAVIASEEELGEKRLLGYLVVDTDKKPSINELRTFLGESLPDYMIPAVFVFLDKMPLTPNGKLDRKALPKGKQPRPDLDQPYIAPKTRLEKVLCKIWSDLLNLEKVGIQDNFFDLGGNSLQGMMMVAQLSEQENLVLPIVKLFQHPSIHTLATHFEKSDNDQDEVDKVFQRVSKTREQAAQGLSPVAIIGMSGRFPGAYDIPQLWRNLCDAKESVTFFSREELGPGLDPEITNHPNYVFARGIIPDGDKFDAAFFGISPAEAKTMDPQQRVFLELAWAALENSGYAPESYDGLIGVYAGIGNNYYLTLNASTHTDIIKMVGLFPVMVGNEKDHIATRTAHKLNLRGPAVSVHTACSTAMTAIDNAFFSLNTHQCDMALAGGISLQVPQFSGQLYEEGGVFSKDGHCRPFDADATGTMFSDSAGIIVMKRLDEAVRDNDTIYAVIKCTAVNNDGAEKVSYLAPSINGQQQVISMALARADVLPDSISYIETHGTGTPIGDPIEVEALSQVYRRFTQKKQFCGIGSIKSNLGHPTIAAGVTGVIKTALALKYEKIPATLHYRAPNPRIDFANSPFYVVAKLQDWPRNEKVRRAAVSAFGFGGTNGHAILEEAPQAEPSDPPSFPFELLLLSAKTPEALQKKTQNLAEHIEQHNDLNLADAAYTLEKGRTGFNHRRFLVCRDNQDAAQKLRSLEPAACRTNLLTTKAPEVVFVFPGQGSQYVNMGIDFYQSDPTFQKTLDQCAQILRPHLGCDLREIIYPKKLDADDAAQTLKNTYYQQPAIFCIEYALAQFLHAWGIDPDAMLGHSIGEFVCATLAGVFTLEDALRLIAARGRLMSELPQGSMLSIRLAAKDVQKRLPDDICLAASNAPGLCVVAGPKDKIQAFSERLAQDKIVSKLLHTSHAFHSKMMDPITKPFLEEVGKTQLSRPTLPIISTLTTKWIKQDDMCDPQYWVRHLRSPVQFSPVITRLLEDPDRIFLEVGPRNVATTLIRQHLKGTKKQLAIPTLGDRADDHKEWFFIQQAVGNLWLNGVEIEWDKIWQGQHRKRIPLPTYPFARKRHWLDPVYVAFQPTLSTSKTQSNEPAIQEQLQTAQSQACKTVTSKDTYIEDQLISILEEISGIEFDDHLDPQMTFSQMGLDSLFLTQISFKIAKDFNIDVTFRQLTEDYTTIPALSRFIEDQLPQPHEAESALNNSVQIEQHTASRVIDLTPSKNSNSDFLESTDLQKEIYELIKKDGNDASRSFNESISVVLSGADFDVTAMKKAIVLLPERHAALRYTYAEDGQTMQLHSKVDLEVDWIDLSDEPPTQMDQKLSEYLQQDFNQVFDVHMGPLFRASIIRLSLERHRVVLTSHLAVCDGWSLDVLVHDLGLLYNQEKGVDKTPLEEPVSFQQYVQEQIAFSKSDTYKKMHSYWEEVLKEPVEALNLRFRPERPAKRSYHGSRGDQIIDPDLVRDIKNTAAHVGCSFFTILLAGLKLLFYRITKEQRILIGMPTAGQAITNHQHLVGNCLHYIPLVSKLEAQQSFVGYLRGLRTIVLDAIENSRCSLSDLSAKQTAPADPTRVPFIQICLNMSPKMEDSHLNYDGLVVQYEVNPRYFESFEMFINAVTGQHDELILQFQYNSDLFSQQEIQRMQKQLEQTLREIVTVPEKRIKDFERYDTAPEVAAGRQEATLSATRQAEKLSSGDIPGYFGQHSELFGIFHIPRQAKSDTGILYCHPLGHEYMRSFWSYKLLSNLLLVKGFPIFKFDYFGTGDSLGDDKDWQMQTWIHNIQTAAEELKHKTGVQKVSIVALRFGSLLAAMAVDQGLAVDQLILWDPLVSGERYLEELKLVHQAKIDIETNLFPYPSLHDLDLDPDEMLGFVYHPSLCRDISQMRMPAYNLDRCRRVDIIASKHNDNYALLLALLQEKKILADYEVIPDSGDWDNPQLFEAAFLPSDILQRISTLLSGVRE